MKQTAALILVTTILAASAGWAVNGWRLSTKISNMKAEHATALTKAAEVAAADTARMQKEKDDAVAKAQQNARRNAAAASAAGLERDRLRDELSASRSAFANSTSASIINYADALTVVFDQCVREYLNMAAKADGHAVDAQKLHDGWKGLTR